jgi:hypothetical protein
MPQLSNHWVVAITAALIVAARMYMYIGNHLHVQFAAFFPNQSELSPIELNDAVCEAVWINIVVIKKLPYRANRTFGAAQKKGAALVNATGTPA